MVEDTSLCFNALKGLPGVGQRLIHGEVTAAALLLQLRLLRAFESCRQHRHDPLHAVAAAAAYPAGPYIKWFLEKLGHDGLNRMLGKNWLCICTLHKLFVP